MDLRRHHQTLPNPSPPDPYPYLWQGFLVDIQCPTIIDQLCRDNQFFKRSQTYALFANDSIDDHLLELFQMQDNVRLDSDITIFTANGFVYDLYKIDNAHNEDAKFILLKNGQWNGCDIHNWNAGVFKIPTRTNLQNISLATVTYVSCQVDLTNKRTTMIYNYNLITQTLFLQLNHASFATGEPWITNLNKSTDPLQYSIHLQMKLFGMLMPKYNFTLRIKTTDSWTASDPEPGQIGGAMELFDQERAVITAVPLRMTEGRVRYGDFASIFWYPQFAFLFRHPKTSSLGAQYLIPFQLPVWFSILATSIFVILFLSIYLRRSAQQKDATVKDYSLFGIVIWVLGFNFQQYSTTPLPQSNSLRLIMISVVFLSFICYEFYCTFIIASLITETPKSIKTLNDLVASGLDIGTTGAPYVKDIFTVVSDPWSI